MPKQIMSKTGNAQIDKQGHTTSGRFGSNVNAKATGAGTKRDLNAK
jgi:hypothetical protein